MVNETEQANSETKQLILLEAGIELHRWLDFVRELGRKGGCLVFAEVRPNLNRIDNPNIEVRLVDEYVPLSGTLDGILYSDACRLVDTWISQPPLSEYAQALEYDGVSLWDMGSYEAGIIVWAILKRVEALRDVLTSSRWERIYSLENRHALWEAFCIATADAGLSGDVQRISMWTSSALYRRLYDLAPGWSSQVARDVYFGLQSRPRPKLFRSYRRKASSRPYLFLVNGYDPYLFTLLPVIQEIRTSHEVLVLNTNKVVRAAQLQEVEVSCCTQYVSFSAWPRIVRRNRELGHVWERLESDARFPPMFEYQGHSLWPALRNPLRNHFLHLFPRMITWVEALKHIFESARPRAVVTVPDRHASNRVAIALARRYGIPSLTVQAALISDSPQYGPLYADKATVIDEYSRRIFMKRGGVAPERVVVTGLPRWDGIPQVISKAKQQSVQLAVREKLGLNAQDKIVTFATQNVSLSLTRRMIHAVMRAMSRYPTMRLVIKLHPAESLKDYEGLLDDFDGIGYKPIIVARVDLHPLLAASELVVAWFSNVVLEAAMLDKPVLIVNLSGEPDPFPFVQQGIAIGAYNETEVVQQFDRLMNDSLMIEELRLRRHNYMQRSPQLLDGRATQRVVTLLQQMIRA